jgi:hypothetical protein
MSLRKHSRDPVIRSNTHTTASTNDALILYTLPFEWLENMSPPPLGSLDEENGYPHQHYHQYCPNQNEPQKGVSTDTVAPTEKSNGTIVANHSNGETILRRTWPRGTFRRGGGPQHKHHNSLPVIVEPSAGSMLLSDQTSSRSWHNNALVGTAPIVEAAAATTAAEDNVETPIVTAAATTTADNSATRVVSLVRLLVLAVLLTSMASTATIVYLYTSHEEMHHFQQAFTDDTNHLVEALSETLYTTMGAVDGYIVSLMSWRKSTNQSWPYVSVPDAAVRLSKLRSLSKGVFVQQAHFVQLHERIQWENYTATHNDWVDESLILQTTDPNYYGMHYNTTNVPHYDVIVGHGGPSTGEGPFLPTWHSSPYVPGTQNTRNDSLFGMRASLVCLARTILILFHLCI